MIMLLLFVTVLHLRSLQKSYGNRIITRKKSAKKPDMGGASCFYTASNGMTLNQRTLNNTICCGIFVAL